MQTHRGFTLIEILIVLLIISIVAGVAVMSTHNNDRKQSELLAYQLRNVIRLAQQEALLRPATLGLAFADNSYQFFIYDFDEKNQKESWLPINDGPLSLHTYSQSLQIAVKVNDKLLTLRGEPILTITPSGKMSQFTIYIGKWDAEPSYQIQGEANGEMSVELFDKK